MTEATDPKVPAVTWLFVFSCLALAVLFIYLARRDFGYDKRFWGWLTLSNSSIVVAVLALRDAVIVLILAVVAAWTLLMFLGECGSKGARRGPRAGRRKFRRVRRNSPRNR